MFPMHQRRFPVRTGSAFWTKMTTQVCARHRLRRMDSAYAMSCSMRAFYPSPLRTGSVFDPGRCYRHRCPKPECVGVVAYTGLACGLRLRLRLRFRLCPLRQMLLGCAEDPYHRRSFRFPMAQACRWDYAMVSGKKEMRVASCALSPTKFVLVNRNDLVTGIKFDARNRTVCILDKAIVTLVWALDHGD
jgi:hypothetical protein